MTQDQRETMFPETGAGEGPGTGAGAGLSWSWHLDFETLLAALSEPAPWNRPPAPACPAPGPAGPSPDRPAPSPGPTGPGPVPAQSPGTPPSADSADPADPADPADLPDPADPPDPADLSRPVESANPADPADPAGPARPADPASPADSSDAADPPDPADPALPADPAELVNPAVPAGLVDPAELVDPAGPAGLVDLVDPVEAEFAEYLDAVDAGRSSVVPLAAAAGRVAEMLPTSPDLAAWLACSPADDLEDGALAGAAAGYRRLAAWAQAGELAAVAQMAARSAAGNETGVRQDGRPDKVPADAYGQVSLALTMTQSGAEWWTNLAVDLQWRLRATGLALRNGTIDLARAQAIAEATAHLDDDKARAVEAKVLRRAGDQTTSQLRASLRRAVITADPEGAERRREQAERRAKVVLYPDAEGTATLTGQRLPSIRAAAAYARITALARALKAAGAEDGIDLLRSKVLIGLLLGTLPYIPPPADGPPDTDGPTGTGPADSHGQPDTDSPPDTGPADSHGSPDTDWASGTGPTRSQPADSDDDGSPHLDDWPWTTDLALGTIASGDGSRGGGHSPEQGSGDGASTVAAEDPGEDPPGGLDPPGYDDQPDNHRPDADEGSPVGQNLGLGAVPWPDATPFLPEAPAALKNLQPAGSGYLDLRLPWLTLARDGPEPGYLTRLGPITPAQASYLAHLAAADPAVRWRAVITDDTGQTIAVARINPPRSPARPAPATSASPAEPASSLLRRITVTISTRELSTPHLSTPHLSTPHLSTPHLSTPPVEPALAVLTAAIIRAARKAAAQAAERAVADAAAGGCAHTQASRAYQVPDRLREFVNLRDLTCRFPTCRQPAWRCDADHTKPYAQGGPTCPCNLGPLCRYHHRLKQHPRWRLSQPALGAFTWTTPTGRTYNAQPDQQAA